MGMTYISGCDTGNRTKEMPLPKTIPITPENHEWLAKQKAETGVPIAFQVNKLIEEARMFSPRHLPAETNEEF